MSSIKDKISKVVDTVKLSAYYMTTFLAFYGVGNTISGESQSLEETVDLFKNGIIDAAPLTCSINIIYAPVVSLFGQTNHQRLYSNLWWAAVNMGVYAYLSMAGSENPLPMTLSAATLGLTLTNLQVSRDQNAKKQVASLEQQVYSTEV